MYTSRQSSDVGRLQMDTINVEEPVSASRWSVNHRVECQRVEEVFIEPQYTCIFF